MMQFASRYDLEEPLLTTTVETFVASDRELQERVLVHVFPAVANGLTESSSPEEILERFHGLTRAQVRIRAVGVDPGSGYAYVVTPEIDTEFIAVWGTQPAPGLAPFSTAIFSSQDVATEGPAAEHVPDPPPLDAYTPALQPAPREPGAFTKEFLALQSRAVQEPRSPLSGQFAAVPKADPIQPAVAPPAATPSEPGFTEMFRNPGSGNAATPKADACRPASAPPPAREGSLTDILRAVDAASGHPELSTPGAEAKHRETPEAAPRFAAIATPQPPQKPPAAAEPSFTDMFGIGPPESSPMPPAAPLRPVPAVPSKPKVGAFTAMFGADEAQAASEAKPGAGDFTRMFEGPAGASPPKPAAASPPIAQAPTPPSPGMPSFGQAGGAAPPGLAPDKATRFFRGNEAAAPPVAKAPLPVGPSEYTKVVRFSDVVKEAAPASPALPPLPQPGAGVPPAGTPGFPQMPAPSFQPPAVPGYPSMPAYPPPVQYQPPPMPAGQPFGIPPVPQVPPMQVPPIQFQPPAPPLSPGQFPAPAPQKSWMPLVILFLGLIILALLIVLLFALKGH